jgi:hypothetical protein
MSAHHHEPAPPPTSPNVNLEVQSTDPSLIDPNFMGGRSPEGPLYSTQKQKNQLPGTKDDPSSYGLYGDAYVGHNFTQIPNVGAEASLIPEVSVDDKARSVASYALWVVNSHTPSRIPFFRRKKPVLSDDVTVTSLAKALDTLPADEHKKFNDRLLKVATEHNTVATINAHKVVGVLKGTSDSVVPKAVQEMGQIITDEGVYGRTRRKARANQRKLLIAASHSVGAPIAKAEPTADRRLKLSRAAKKTAKQKDDGAHHAHEIMTGVAAVNRRLAFRHGRKLAKEINNLVALSGDRGAHEQTYVHNAQELGLQDGNFRVRVGDKYEKDWRIFGTSVKVPKSREDSTRKLFIELEGPMSKRMVVSADELLDWQILDLH